MHVARYFVYVFALVAFVWALCFVALSASMEAGVVYPANWGAAHAREVAARIQEEGSFSPRSVPTAYRYALFAEDGALVSTDMDEVPADLAGGAGLGAAGGGEVEISGSAGSTYVAFSLADGTSCVLATAYMPQFTSSQLRDSLPNPQNIMLAAGCAGSMISVALVAMKAGRFIGRKLQPLTDAAARVARQDLAFPVEVGGVREVDEVLSAMDDMRASLKESLEARWDAERRQRDQVAALAHDLKTPLTVIRANTEYLEEEAVDLVAAGEPAAPDALVELADAARAAAEGTKRLDSYVHLLINVSRGRPVEASGGGAAVGELALAVEAEGRALARAAGVDLALSVGDGMDGLTVAGDADSLVRAIMNVVSNAVEHAFSRVSVSLRTSEDGALEVIVTDDGEGFSDEALERGCERFFRGEHARSGEHYGLGLAIASEIAGACGGTLAISNLDSGKAPARGARVLLRIPGASRR